MGPLHLVSLKVGQPCSLKTGWPVYELVKFAIHSQHTWHISRNLRAEYGNSVAAQSCHPSCHNLSQASQSSGASSASQTKGAQGASTPTSGQTQAGSTTSAHQPVEFNHAINYVNKIKVHSLLFIVYVCACCTDLHLPYTLFSLFSLFNYPSPLLFSPSLSSPLHFLSFSPIFFPLLPSPLTESFPASPRHLQGILGDLTHLSKGTASHQRGRNS